MYKWREMSLPRRIWSKGFLFFWWEKRIMFFFFFSSQRNFPGVWSLQGTAWVKIYTNWLDGVQRKKCQNQQFVVIDAWIYSFSDRASRWSMGRVVFLDCVWQRLRNRKTEKTSLLWQSVSFAWRKGLSRSSTGNGRLQYRKLPKYVNLMKERYY